VVGVPTAPAEDLLQRAAPNQSVSGSELPVSNRKSLERRRGDAQVHPFGGCCGGDRVLGLGAARGGPGRHRRHRPRLTRENVTTAALGGVSAVVASGEIPQAVLLHAAAWPRGLPEDQDPPIWALAPSNASVVTGRPVVPAARTPANQRGHASELPVSRSERLERRSAMRKLVRLAITAAVTAFLVWVLPAAAHAGLSVTGAD
jgi:hypothetical protein